MSIVKDLKRDWRVEWESEQKKNCDSQSEEELNHLISKYCQGEDTLCLMAKIFPDKEVPAQPFTNACQVSNPEKMKKLAE